MLLKAFVGFFTSICLIFYNSSNAAVDINFYKSDEYHIICNGESKTFDGSEESLYEVNNLIFNYFSIGAINYNDKSNTLQVKCSHLENNEPCILILTNTNKDLFPSIVFNGANNKFYEVMMLGFKDIIV